MPPRLPRTHSPTVRALAKEKDLSCSPWHPRRVKKREVQLVIQFPEDYFSSVDAIVAFEGKLRGCMPKTCAVDGYDVGSGTVNFFVYTSAPAAAHRTFRTYLGTRAVEKRLRIAWRDLDAETFTNLWPRRDPRPFDYSYSAAEDPFARGAKRVIPKRRAPAPKSTAEPSTNGREVAAEVPASPLSAVVAKGARRAKRRALTVPTSRESSVVPSASVRAKRARAAVPPSPESTVFTSAAGRAKAPIKAKGAGVAKGKDTAKARAPKSPKKERIP